MRTRVIDGAAEAVTAFVDADGDLLGGGTSTFVTGPGTFNISAQRCRVNNLRPVGGTMGNITCYNGSTMDPICLPTFTPAAGVTLLENAKLSNGLTIVLAAATHVVVSHQPLED